ncbi:hypothetical protein [Spartinivicinus poritis]|uniref:Phage protein n=1 Tax=Spartinivicinus poritis TaxID=2994640 RepID=A0ABT5UHJ7_9GAMM|nr:hypothetical protein [Spartinivicinus sp. A2-2]MDE1465466.1 hypothetical protein [Spartinivicinus sp. A2-2]
MQQVTINKNTCNEIGTGIQVRSNCKDDDFCLTANKLWAITVSEIDPEGFLYLEDNYQFDPMSGKPLMEESDIEEMEPVQWIAAGVMLHGVPGDKLASTLITYKESLINAYTETIGLDCDTVDSLMSL